MTPSLSIVVPVYNLEFYVERCLASLANQTLSDLEVLVINDGGTDESQAIIDEFVAAHPQRFFSFIKENGGHGAACNFGIDRARGEYVMIVDGDDFLDPEVSEFMVKLARQEDADVVMGNLNYIYPDSTDIFRPIALPTNTMLADEDRRKLYSNWATPCGRIYRRTLFADPDVRFLPGVLFADVNFAPKTYLKAARIFYVDKALYNYDITRPTQSIKQTDKRVMDVLASLDDMIQFYIKQGAFEARRQELQTYVVRHCFAWIAKLRTLQGYPRPRAIHEVMTFPSRYFGSVWQWSGALKEEHGALTVWKVRAASLVRYRPLLWHKPITKLARKAVKVLRLKWLRKAVAKKVAAWTKRRR